MNSISNELIAKVSELRDLVLKGINYSAESRDITVEFQHWNGSILIVHLSGILQLSVSSSEVAAKTAESVVVGAALKVLEDGGKTVLRELGHFFLDPNDGVNSYPGIRLLYFSIDGDTCLGVICREIEFVSP